jgi:hypothetical protein
MKRTNNDGVIASWKAGKVARNSRFTLHSTGQGLYSYQLQIGMRTDSGITVLADYTAGADSFQSQTTSCHVGRVRRAGVDLVMHPKVWEISPLSEEDEEMPF